MESKETNPKDSIGVSKSPLSKIPMQVVYEAGLGMLEGACKYGAFNYRAAGVRASVYYDALQRHMNAWWEGEDIDPDSGLSHVTKAITTLMVLRDAMLNDKLNDDRPPSVKNPNWLNDYNKKAAEIVDKYKDKNPVHYTILNNPIVSYEIEYKAPETFSLPKPAGPENESVTVPFIFKRRTDFPCG